MADNVYLKNAIKNKKANYFCKKHNRVHKYGTAIWEKDLKVDLVSSKGISEEVKKEQRKLTKKSVRGGKAFYLKQKKEIQDTMNKATKEAETTLRKPRYYAYELVYFSRERTELRILGKYEGYVSMKELMGDRYTKSTIERARKDKESVVYITKGTLVKTIGK